MSVVFQGQKLTEESAFFRTDLVTYYAIAGWLLSHKSELGLRLKDGDSIFCPSGVVGYISSIQPDVGIFVVEEVDKYNIPISLSIGEPQQVAQQPKKRRSRKSKSVA